MASAAQTPRQRRLLRMIHLAIAAAVATMALKISAWLITGSVGLLSDAAESLVNLAAAVVAMVVVRWAGQPADEDHAYGHEKADYLSAGAEGTMIIVAAIVIAVSAIGRLIHPVELQQVGLGLVITAVAAVINFAVARQLVRVGREESSLTLIADGRHLYTDVITSVGVIFGIIIVVATGVDRLDPVIALIVAVNIVITGASLVRGAFSGLLDHALLPDEIEHIEGVLDRYRDQGLAFHALRTRRAANRAFVSLHVLVPGGWSVQHGHDTAEQIESDLRKIFETATIFTHLEPLEDPLSFADTQLDRDDDARPSASEPHTRRRHRSRNGEPPVS